MLLASAAGAISLVVMAVLVATALGTLGLAAMGVMVVDLVNGKASMLTGPETLNLTGISGIADAQAPATPAAPGSGPGGSAPAPQR